MNNTKVIRSDCGMKYQLKCKNRTFTYDDNAITQGSNVGGNINNNAQIKHSFMVTMLQQHKGITLLTMLD